MPPDTSLADESSDVLRGIGLSLPLILWPFLARPGALFLAGTFLLVLVPLFVARTATQLIVVLFVYYGVDGYLRLLFDYSWSIYVLPLLALLLVYLRWFTGPQWRRSRGVFSRNPIAIPLVGFAGLCALQVFNGVPFNFVVSVGGFAYHLATVPLFFVAASGFWDARQIRRILWFIVGLAVFECAYALGQYYLGAPELLALSQRYQARIADEAWWTPGSSQLIYRPTGLTLSGGGPGMYGIIGVVLVLGLFGGWQSGRGSKLALFVGVFTMLVAVFLSAVRAFWLGLLVALLVFGVLQGVRYLILMAGVGWAAAAVAISWTSGALYARLSTLFTPWVAFTQTRGGDIRSLPNIVTQHPLGIGIGRATGSAAGRAMELFPEGAYAGAHNYWVSLTWEASFLAPLLFGWLLWRLFRFGLSLFQRASDRGTRSIIAAILAFDAGIVVMTLAGPALAGVASSFAQYFWFLSGLLFALASSSAQPGNAQPTTRLSVAHDPDSLPFVGPQ